MTQRKIRNNEAPQQAHEIQQVQDCGLPIGTRPENPEAERKEPAEKWAPISIDRIFPIATQICKGNFEIVVPVRTRIEARRPYLQETGKDRDTQANSAKNPKTPW